MTELRDDVFATEQASPGPPTSEERLLRAATTLFSDKGFEATRTRDISTTAGMSPSAMYVHFPSKEDLLFQLVRRSNERALALVLSAVAPFTDPIDRLRALVREFSIMHARNFRRARIAQYESRHLSPEHRETVAETRLQIRSPRCARCRTGSIRVCSSFPTPASPFWRSCPSRWTSAAGTAPTANSRRRNWATSTPISFCASSTPPATDGPSDAVRDAQRVRPHPRESGVQFFERE